MQTPIDELLPQEAHARQRTGAVLIDVRESGERAAGMAEGAIGVSRAELEAAPAQWLADLHAPVMLICASGVRSRQCAEALQRCGYTRLASVRGGTQAWQAAQLPMSAAAADPEFLDRYARHLRLPEIGLEGQRALGAARVALIGAGGLGSPAALYLAAAGVGHITLIDDDVVERSNLQRQILHRDADIGVPKVDSATRALLAINPRIAISARRTRLDTDHAIAMLSDHDVVVDGSDNFATRYLVNDACAALQIPLVYGAVQSFDGQVAVFWPARARGGCYRCLFPAPPAAALAPNCSQAGVLGVLPGVIGVLQATEAIKLILGIGEPLTGTLLELDLLGMRFNRIALQRDPDCPCCGERLSDADGGQSDRRCEAGSRFIGRGTDGVAR
ncbi:Molybdopterin or thiamine biosynthesis adenylyltransferase [Paraburkholderia tropica]|uniref:molybdopterin-synthase adenylyltransferase MoeB n=1 Tax=Paraburkholderia tropica TaxID=92647 RepID=UPI001CB63B34|nr:molybdopterin-synthase adenylyltransferase MoeB [Paraburkholderia tropica]CAG9192924.1 Molybdopterin or thiamine biosynthesis adenylyltransferase [Paraburkholderia tropica]